MALTVISTLDLDMAHPGVNIVHAKQYDSSGRVIRAHLMNEEEPWQVPSDAYPVIRYRKTDRKGGFYDTDENGEYAINFPVNGDRSYINIILDVQTLTTAGNVHMEINFYNADAIRVSTFSWTVAVEASAMSDAEVVSSDDFNALTNAAARVIEQTSDII